MTGWRPWPPAEAQGSPDSKPRVSGTARIYSCARAGLETEEPGRLDDERAVHQLRIAPEVRVSAVAIHDEELAGRAIIPSQPCVRAEGAAARGVLSQGAHKHPRRKIVRRSLGDDRRGELSIWKIDPVDREPRLERKLRGDLRTSETQP